MLGVAAGTPEEGLILSGVMKIQSSLFSGWFWCVYLLILLFVLQSSTTTVADLKSDRQALLDFASATPHARRLKWKTTSKNSSDVCSSWPGVSCSSDGTRVTALRLPGYGLLGPIPDSTLGRLDALSTLSLRSNSLNGTLPSDLLSLPSLRYVNLQQNAFSGDIPSTLSTQLNVIDFSSNSLTGNIPLTLQNLTHLTTLNLQGNQFSGAIPDLNLPNLKQLNFSNNNLNGSIPSYLQKFPASSFLGNSMLCGRPLDTNCPSISPSPSPSPSPSLSPSPSQPLLPPYPSPPTLNTPTLTIPPPPPPPPPPPQQSNTRRTLLSTGAIVAMGVVGAAVLFGLAVAMLILCLKKKKGVAGGVLKGQGGGGTQDTPKEEFGSEVQETKRNKLVFFGDWSYSFNLEDLLRASAEVLGKGSYGTTYTAILEEGTTVVVKRLREVFANKREFEKQMKSMGGMIAHLNIVPLRAYYHSKDEKLLVYDHVPGPSLSTLLHGNGEAGTSLAWESRVKISLGAAKGVAHIHSAAGKLSHGNIKSSNVLVVTQEEFNARVTDFGLTPLMGFPTIPSRSAGYRAPELAETKKSTQNSDVYSFGVLLLELLTGKALIQSPGHGHDEVVDLPRWVHSVVREEWTAEVFDPDLVKYPNIEEEMVRMLQIAMACVARVPDTRPAMDEVVRMIDGIRQSDSENQMSTSDKVQEPSS